MVGKFHAWSVAKFERLGAHQPHKFSQCRTAQITWGSGSWPWHEAWAALGLMEVLLRIIRVRRYLSPFLSISSDIH